MFKKTLFRLSVVAVVLTVVTLASVSRADTFGTGVNQFSIDFVPISGSTNPTPAQTNAGDLDGFGIVNNDYRMGVYEITNAQWDKFKTELAPVSVTGDPPSAYDRSATYTGTNVPTNNVSWYEAAQMVNWLNTSEGHQAAYKFTGTQGEPDYALATWNAAEAAGGTNLYRHKDAFYFLPTEDEWFKAAYWNGFTILEYATRSGTLQQGDGTSGTGWNYNEVGFGTDLRAPWDVGSGSEELNGTYDMMGNVWEWTESPFSDPGYDVGSTRGVRGGYWGSFGYSPPLYLHASSRAGFIPSGVFLAPGFRVASVPEPGSITLLLCGLVAGLIWWRCRK